MRKTKKVREMWVSYDLVADPKRIEIFEILQIVRITETSRSFFKVSNQNSYRIHDKIPQHGHEMREN